jgi:hypothetical protein
MTLNSLILDRYHTLVLEGVGEQKGQFHVPCIFTPEQHMHSHQHFHPELKAIQVPLIMKVLTEPQELFVSGNVIKAVLATV